MGCAAEAIRDTGKITDETVDVLNVFEADKTLLIQRNVCIADKVRDAIRTWYCVECVHEGTGLFVEWPLTHIVSKVIVDVANLFDHRLHESESKIIAVHGVLCDIGAPDVTDSSMDCRREHECCEGGREPPCCLCIERRYRRSPKCKEVAMWLVERERQRQRNTWSEAIDGVNVRIMVCQALDDPNFTCIGRWTSHELGF
mmetsp:Transcript_21976/g.36315  ORF Transcript_21976/g.36315 Transcript_21976/m.36315 type:complete len:200 (+) Transcript_21976:572-1171(+)